MPPASFNLTQRLAALSLGPSSSHSPGPTCARDGHVNGNESYSRSPTSPNAQRKTFFNPPSWVKKPRGFTRPNTEISVGEEEKRMMQEVLARMIFQAGVDFECALVFSEIYNSSESVMSGHDQCKCFTISRVRCSPFHRVVLNASALPNPQVVSYDLLLT